jgi:glycosyltransferase involved in cell wall biosynthesis
MIKNIGIISYGSNSWIAGRLYIQSLLTGQAYLEDSDKQNLYLFIFAGENAPNAYEESSEEVRETHLFYTYFGLRFPLLTRILIACSRYVKKQRPLFPENNLPALLKDKKIDVLFPANGLLSKKHSKAAFICWLPDFQELYLPENFSFMQRLQRKLAFRRMVKQADKVVLSNPFSYRDACRLAPDAAHKFDVLPFCMHLGKDWRSENPECYRLKYNLPACYLMFPSQAWRHKNHSTLFEALYLLKQRGMVLTLVCTGLFEDPRFPAYGQELRDYIESHDLQGQILLLGLLPRQDQVQLMRGARAIVQPSLFEGWSALLEDCRGLGKTVFVSEIPMHTEQQPDHAIYFDPHQPQQLADLIEHHWDRLPAGGDTGREQEGERKNREQLKSFALKFNEICKSVTTVQINDPISC